MTTTTKARTRKTPEQKQAERAQLTQTVEEFDTDRITDDDDLATAYTSLTMHYSERNAILILAQDDRVTGIDDVGAYGTWLERGRKVNTGEHSHIKILAPTARAEQGDVVEEETLTAPDGTTVKRRTGFRIASLFHVTQTHEMTAEERMETARRRQARAGR
jgi:hypothetical protein